MDDYKFMEAKTENDIRVDEKKRVLKFVLNQIPCEKNCNCCLRNGISDCFVPTKKMEFYIQDIVSILKEQLELDLPIDEYLSVVEWDGYTLDIKKRIEQLKEQSNGSK